MVAQIDDDGDGMVDIDEFENMVLTIVQRIRERVRIGGGGVAAVEHEYKVQLAFQKEEIQDQLGHGHVGEQKAHTEEEEEAMHAAAKHQISFGEHHTTGVKDGGLRRNSFMEAAGVGLSNERPLKDLPHYYMSS